MSSTETTIAIAVLGVLAGVATAMLRDLLHKRARRRSRGPNPETSGGTSGGASGAWPKSAGLATADAAAALVVELHHAKDGPRLVCRVIGRGSVMDLGVLLAFANHQTYRMAAARRHRIAPHKGDLLAWDAGAAIGAQTPRYVVHDRFVTSPPEVNPQPETERKSA